MTQYLLPISIFVIIIVVLNSGKGIIVCNVKLENDFYESVTNVEKSERTSLLLSFATRRKRDIVSRKRKTTEQLELLKIPEREWSQVRVKNRGERHDKDLQSDNSEILASAAPRYLPWKKGKDRYVDSCVICNISFWFDKDYVNHCVEKHGNLHPYRCPHCQRKFKWKRNLKQHVDKKHEAKANPFSRWNDKKRREITCEICGETSPNLLAFEHHALSKHEKERMMACSDCPKKYFSRCALLKHLRLKHEAISSVPNQAGGEQNRNDSSLHREEKVARGKSKTGGIYTCPYCNLNTYGLVEYEKHGKSMHEGLPLYHCGECQKGFIHRNTVKLHCKEKHDNDKVRCSRCSKCYSHLGDLRKHEYVCERKARNEALRKEQGLPSYTCDICKRVLYTKWKSFKKHVNEHKNYVYCHICKQGFNKFRNSQALADHIRVRHPLMENIDALLKMAATVKVEYNDFSE